MKLCLLIISACCAAALSTPTFDSELLHIATQNRTAENVIVSPASIQTVLGLAYFGARGKSADELAHALRLENKHRPDVLRKFREKLEGSAAHSKLVIANKIWVNSHLEVGPKFKSIAEEHFKSEVEAADFANRTAVEQDIENWALQKTHNQIKNVLRPGSITADSKMVVVSTIYFKGTWKSPFKANYSSKADFWTSPDRSVKAHMMLARRNVLYGHLGGFNATAIELPYTDANLSMLIILPQKRDGLRDLEERLLNVDLLSFEKRMNPKDVEIHLPKFKAEFAVGLKDVLKEMGVKKIFQSDAEFSGVFKNNVPARVQDIQHKAFIQVDENGSEAAASTYLDIVGVSGRKREKRKIFKADHPFVFAIKDDKMVYFAGHLSKL